MALSHETRAYVLKLALLGAAGASITYLSLFLIPSGGSGASLVWPPAALGIAALFLFGTDLWPALLLSFFAVLLWHGITPPGAAGGAVADTLEALAGVYVLRRLNFHPMFSRMQDALVFALAAFTSALLSATITTLTMHFVSGMPFSQQFWLGLWIGHSVSLLSFGPFFIRWVYKPHFTRTRGQWIEGVVVVGAIVIINLLIFWAHYSTLDSISLLYLLIIPMIWAALRTGPRGMSLALMLMALIAGTGALFGNITELSGAILPNALLSVQLIVGTLSLIFLLFSSIVEERKEATNELHGHVGQLEVALEKIRSEDQAKSDFIAILAHELRNPLSPLLSGLELMKIRKQGPADLLSMMGSHLNTMARLLDDLLDISRVSQKKFKLQRQPVKLETVVAQSLEMVAPYLAERGHTLTTVLPENEIWIDGDQVRLVQIVVNLLTNAAKYTDRGGRVRLEARCENYKVVVTVSDNGIGIDSSRLKKIFEPFGSTDIGRGSQGLHIGLSLAKRMAEMHEGTVEVHSEGVGHGSTFTVRLPLCLTAPLISEQPSRRSRFSDMAIGQSRRELGSLEVLVVDDNEAAAASLGKLLEHNGHRALIAYDAPQALALCEGHTPGVALLDIGLPGMDGYALGRLLRQRFGETLMLVALTGYGQAEDKQKAREAGFDEHLTKPVSIVDVERVLLELGKPPKN